jgi:hypothetical protein
MITLTAGVAKQALGIISDGVAAYASRFASLPADEAVVLDFVDLAASFGVPFAAQVEAFAPLIEWVIANNQSVQSGSLTRIAGGGRGNDPFRDTSFGG